MSVPNFGYPEPGDLYFEAGTEFSSSKSWLVIEYKDLWMDNVDSYDYDSVRFMGWKCMALDLECDGPPRLICIPRVHLFGNGDSYTRAPA